MVSKVKQQLKDNNNEENLAFVFPPGLSKRIRKLQTDLGLKSASEVLVKALSLLEVSFGRTIEIKDKDEKWEINEFEEYEKTVSIRPKD